MSYSTSQQTKSRTEYPKRYNVVMHNDDFTTMDFVVKVLRTVFFKTTEAATELMLAVHTSGKAVVGTYSYDIAASKAAKALDMANDEGFPFKVTLEPVEVELPF